MVGGAACLDDSLLIHVQRKYNCFKKDFKLIIEGGN